MILSGCGSSSTTLPTFLTQDRAMIDGMISFDTALDIGNALSKWLSAFNISKVATFPRQTAPSSGRQHHQDHAARV